MVGVAARMYDRDRDEVVLFGGTTTKPGSERQVSGETWLLK